MSMRMFAYSNDVMSIFRKCLEMRDAEVGGFKSATSGLMAVMIALHMCEHVSVFGIGEAPLQDGTPYQYFAKAGPWTSREAPNTNHNMTLEAGLISALARAGLLRHCTIDGCIGIELPFAEL